MIDPVDWEMQCGAGAWTAPNATLVGVVSLGDNSSVWYSAVLRGDGEPISIGERTNIQDGVVVHTDPGFPVHVGDRVSVGHNAVLHGCTIGDDVLVGMTAVLMNGVVVGNGSLIGAGALLPSGMIVPPGSLVIGVPASVRRPLRSDELAMVLENADTYVALADRHRAAHATRHPWGSGRESEQVARQPHERHLR